MFPSFLSFTQAWCVWWSQRVSRSSVRQTRSASSVCAPSPRERPTTASQAWPRTPLRWGSSTQACVLRSLLQLPGSTGSCPSHLKGLILSFVLFDTMKASKPVFRDWALKPAVSVTVTVLGCSGPDTWGESQDTGAVLSRCGSQSLSGS